MIDKSTIPESGLGSSVSINIDGQIARVTLSRPEKRNAFDDTVLQALENFFSSPPKGVRVAILTGEGEHFSAGLDLSGLVKRNSEEVMHHSRWSHRVMDSIQFGGLPVVSVLKGAVMGGGLEIAAATHVRIAEASTIFQLPEGQRGIFVGAGATVRVGKILGPDRMVEMMLTQRQYDAEEGLNLGLAHYTCGVGQGMEMAEKLARKIASNATLINHIIIQSLSRISDMSRSDGLFTESLCAALTQTSPDAEEGLRAFLEKREPNFR